MLGGRTKKICLPNGGFMMCDGDYIIPWDRIRSTKITPKKQIQEDGYGGFTCFPPPQNLTFPSLFERTSG